MGHGIFYAIIQLLMIMVAIYFVFKRNRRVLTLTGLRAFIAALCCTPCYIAYALAVPIG